jgi:uncharacterized protein
MAEAFHRKFFLAGPAGRLEATLWTTAKTAPGLSAVVCHPHPLFGGTMHNKVVFRVARTLHALGLPVLRFNFRGAGLSAGRHDQGRGEADDVRAAIAWLAGEFPGRALLLAGFSFGAWVGLRVGCEDERIAELIGLGLPVNDSDLSYLRGCAKPKLLLQGERDQYGAHDRLEALFAALPEPKRLEFVPGADHFFTGQLAAVDHAMRSWLVERHGALAQEPSRTPA